MGKKQLINEINDVYNGLDEQRSQTDDLITNNPNQAEELREIETLISSAMEKIGDLERALK